MYTAREPSEVKPTGGHSLSRSGCRNGLGRRLFSLSPSLYGPEYVDQPQKNLTHCHLTCNLAATTYEPAQRVDSRRQPDASRVYHYKQGASAGESQLSSVIPLEPFAMPGIGVVECNLIESWAAGPLFGINIVLFIIVANALLNVRRESASAKWLLVVSALQLVVSAGHVGALLARTIIAFVFMDDATREAYLADERTPLHTAEQGLYTVNDIIAGGILTWRCYVVWNYNWRPCVILVVSCVGTAVCGIGSIVKLTALPANQAVFFESAIKAWLTAFWVQSAATQTIATGLIAWKIWSTISWRAKRFGSREWHALLVFIESGALYSGGTILVLVFYLLGSNIGTIVAGMLGQLSATAPYLIIVRSEARRAASVASVAKAAADHALRALPMYTCQPQNWKRSTGSRVGSSEAGAVEMKQEQERISANWLKEEDSVFDD
ncbi:hypothetical protein PENSPDRAFT_758047 [Peniophora sp. CONT]|nr:hypothetical protein PENSPDRAFT_758047 [Peniophora sp. CONT]